MFQSHNQQPSKQSIINNLFLLTFTFLTILSISGYSQNSLLLDIEGDSRIKGILHISDSIDISSINIRNNRNVDFKVPLDSAAYYLNLHKNNVLIGLPESASTSLRNSTTLGTSAGQEQSGEENISVGNISGGLSAGNNNISIGIRAGAITDGDDNIHIGRQPLPEIIGMGQINRLSKNNNVILGSLAGKDLTTGSENTFIGTKAGHNVTSGNRNIIIGYEAGPTGNTNDKLYIGKDGFGGPLIFGDFDRGDVEINGELFISNSIYGDLNGNVTGNVSGVLTTDSTLSLIHLGENDDKGITFAETDNPVFGFIYDGEGTGNENRLHLRKYLGGTSDIITFKVDGKIGIGGENPITPLHIMTGTDVEDGAGGYLTLGSPEGNIAIDNNEIMARKLTDQPNELYLNNNGGGVVIGSRLQLAYSNVDNLGDISGQIKFNKTTNDFEGYDGMCWYSLTTNKTSIASGQTCSNRSIKTNQANNYDELIRENKILASRITKLESAIEKLLNQVDE